MIDRYDYFEFSKIYKRVMDIELCLKSAFTCANNSIAQNTKFQRLIPFITEKSAKEEITKIFRTFSGNFFLLLAS